MKVLVIDDDKLICASLKTILESDKEITVVGLGNSVKEAVELFYKTQPDVLLLDIRMGEMSGLDAAEAVLKMQKDAKVLFLTTFADDEYIIKALKIGARGYILKQNFESIVPAVKAVNIGQYVFGEDIVAKLPELLNKSGKNSFESYGISDKEQEIISLVAEGLNNKEIAAKLYLSEGTVRNYLSAILDKLNLRDRTQLAVFYFKNK